MTLPRKSIAITALGLAFLLIGSQASFSAEIKETSLSLPESSKEYALVRIALAQKARNIMVETDAPYQIMDSAGKPLLTGARFAAARIKPGASGIQIGAHNYQADLVTLLAEKGAIKLDGNSYRHAIEFSLEPGSTLSIINEIPMEDYLKGVLPKEASTLWPLEALKAQAVAARTYALFKAIENRDEKYVLSKGVLSQVYGGKTAENSVTNRAVDMTEGQILIYKGKIFPAYFHSTCGGATTHAEYIWDVKPHPALQGVKCSFCQPSKHYRWQLEFSRAQIESKLRKNGYPAKSGIQDIQPVDLDATGRAKNFEILFRSGQKLKIRSNDFRLWLDPLKFKSTWISLVERRGEKFVFRGKGWGHGVGLCQYGMKALAELGYNYSDILKYYYPGAEIMNLNSLEEAVPAKPEGKISSLVGKVKDMFET